MRARSGLRQLNSGKIYRKVGRADCGNDFSDSLRSLPEKASDILRNPLSDRSLSHRGFQLTCLKTHFLNLQKEIMPCTPWPFFHLPCIFQHSASDLGTPKKTGQFADGGFFIKGMDLSGGLGAFNLLLDLKMGICHGCDLGRWVMQST